MHSKNGKVKIYLQQTVKAYRVVREYNWLRDRGKDVSLTRRTRFDPKNIPDLIVVRV